MFFFQYVFRYTSQICTFGFAFWGLREKKELHHLQTDAPVCPSDTHLNSDARQLIDNCVLSAMLQHVAKKTDSVLGVTTCYNYPCPLGYQ
jgi:hypothetical protein